MTRGEASLPCPMRGLRRREVHVSLWALKSEIRSWTRLFRNVKDVECVIKDCLWLVAQKPFESIGVGEQLSGKMGYADHDSPAGVAHRQQRCISDAVNRRIEGSEICEMDLL